MERGLFLGDLVGDRLHEVGLPEARPAVDIEGVEVFPGRFRDRLCRGIDELVGGPHDEGIEGEALVEDDGRLLERVRHFGEGVCFAPLHDDDEIAKPRFRTLDGFAQFVGAGGRDGARRKLGIRLKHDLAVDDIFGNERLDELTERDGVDDLFRALFDLVPDNFQLGEFRHFIL